MIKKTKFQDLNLLALDSDLRLFGESVISDKWPDKLVVQVQKVKNVSAPKINQYQQPKMILATITDGKVKIDLVKIIEFEKNDVFLDVSSNARIRTPVKIIG